MRARRYCFFVIIIAVVTLISTINSRADNPNMIAAWTFDEGSGDTTADVTGNGHDGIVVGKVEWVKGKNGTGLKFMDTTQYVEVADAEDLHFGDSDFTFAAWVNIEDFDGDTPPMIMSKRATAAGDGKPVINFGLDLETRVLRVAMRDDKAGLNPFTANTGIKEGVWSHVALVKEKETITFYLNGAEDANLKHGFAGGFTSDDNPFYIGVHKYGGSVNCSLHGTLDEVAIFNKALSGEEIRSLMPNVMAVEASGKLSASWGYIKSAY